MSVHFQHSGLSSSCTECRAGGQVLLPTVSSDPCSAQGLEGRGTQAFRPESQSPLFLRLSLTVQGTHQLRVAGQMPRCPCSCETFLNTSRSQTTPSAKSSKQTQCSVHLSPKPSLDPWKSSGSWTPSSGRAPPSDSAYPQGLHHLCCHCRLCSESLKTWTHPGPQRGWSPHSTRSSSGPDQGRPHCFSPEGPHLVQLWLFCCIDLVLVLSTVLSTSSVCICMFNIYR